MPSNSLGKVFIVVGVFVFILAIIPILLLKQAIKWILALGFLILGLGICWIGFELVRNRG